MMAPRQTGLRLRDTHWGKRGLRQTGTALGPSATLVRLCSPQVRAGWRGRSMIKITITIKIRIKITMGREKKTEPCRDARLLVDTVEEEAIL